MSPLPTADAAARINPVALHHQLQRIWGTRAGWQQLAAVNHNVLGKRFMATALAFFAIGGLLAMLLRAQLATSQSTFVGPALYNQLFSLHGTVMMFLFAIPMLEGMAIYLLPKMLGARDLAFPRLTAYGYWCYLFGGIIVVSSLLFGVAPDSGWFMYTPLSSRPFTPGVNADVWLLGITFVEISAVSAAVEIAASILKLRAPGMSLDRMPLFAWYLLVTSLMMVVGFPPLILASILLELERTLGLPFFDPARGGDPLLWQHLFWLFGHPEVYIIFLPAMGVLSTLIPVFARTTIIGYRAIIIAIVALAFLSFGLWVHHMFTVGIPHLALAFFSAASALVAIPTAVQIFSWLSTLAQGRPKRSVPMLYVAGFFFIFVIGGLTGVMLAMVPFNWQAHDTHFVVAHLHYVLIGGLVFPMLAGIYYWLPHVSGRQTLQQLSIPAFWLTFIGFNLTFFLMHLTGLLGMPRRVATYHADAGWDGLNLLSSVGGFVMTMGLALVFVDLILHFRFGRRFARNPWQAGTLEWSTPTPAPAYAFASLPHVEHRADSLDVGQIGRQLAAGEGYLAFTRENRLETLGVDVTTGRLEHLVVLPQRSYLPLISAVLTAAMVLSLLFSLYTTALVLTVLVIASFVVWSQRHVIAPNLGRLDVGRGEAAPPHTEVAAPASWWATSFALVANGTLFASLLFGALYNWLVAANWPPAHVVRLGWPALMAGAALLAIPLAARGVIAVIAGPAPRRAWLALVALALAHAVTLVGVMVEMASIDKPTDHAHLATAAVLLGYVAVHAAIGLLLVLNAAIKLSRGLIAAGSDLELRIGKLCHDYTAVTGVLALLTLVAMPSLIGVMR